MFFLNRKLFRNRIPYEVCHGTEKKLPFIIVSVIIINLYPAYLYAHGWMAPSHEASQSDSRPINQHSIELGHSLFTQFCAQCHGKDAQGLPKTITQLGSDAPNLPQRLKSHSDGDFYWKINRGRGDMPAFEKELTAYEIWDIIHFIRTLAD